MLYPIYMGLLAWVKGLFSKKETRSDPIEIATKLTILRLGQDLHSQTLTELVERLKYSEEFKNLVANAFTNLDSRIDSLEKMTAFIYEKTGEHEGKLDSLEDRTTSTEFSKLADNIEEN